MLHYHMAMITRDPALRRAVKRLTTATGATADFLGNVSGLSAKRPLDLAIFDARRENPGKEFRSKIPASAKVIYILEGDTLVEKLPLLKDPRVTSLFCHDARFDDDEFIASATKALRGEVFGLQKYFPWGVTTFTMQVKNYEQKGRALEILAHYARLAGVRGPVRDRIQLVCDELMMNALYHAPTDEHGLELFRERSLRDLAQLPEVPPIQVQYGCSGRYFGVSVRDAGGSLTRERLLDYLRRAAGEAHIETKATGAGLGLVSVLRSVSKLVFNLEPGYSTEVIGLFDMELFAKGKVGARSLHVFTAPAVEGDEEEERDIGGAAGRGGRSSRWWLVAVLLAIITTGLATAYAMRMDRSARIAQAAPQPTLTVVATPDDATVTLNGDPIQNGSPVPIPQQDGDVTVEVTKPGYEPWSRVVPVRSVTGDASMYVTLSRLGGHGRNHGGRHRN